MSSSKKTERQAASPEQIEQTEQDPAVERGERIDSAKEIARSGKSSGKVEGATPKNDSAKSDSAKSDSAKSDSPKKETSKNE